MITAVPQKPEIQEYFHIYSKLQIFVDSVDTKLINKIQSIQHNFADQYKHAVRVMNEQLQEIRSRLDAAALKQKTNQKIKLLEEQRNCFREMSRDLDMKLKEEVKVNKDLKQDIKVLQDELANYKKICFNLELQMTKSRKQMAEIYRHKSLNKQRREKPIVDLQPIKESNKSLHQTKKTLANPNSQMKRSFSSTLYRSQKIKLQPKLKIIKSSFQFQQVLANCIKAIKKQVFYRTGSTISTNYCNFMQDQAMVPFQKLTLTDKKQLIRMFMEDSKVLQKFYTFVFNNNSGDQQKTVRPFDSKYNTSNLMLIKRKFQDRLASNKLATVRNS